GGSVEAAASGTEEWLSCAGGLERPVTPETPGPAPVFAISEPVFEKEPLNLPAVLPCLAARHDRTQSRGHQCHRSRLRNRVCLRAHRASTVRPATRANARKTDREALPVPNPCGRVEAMLDTCQQNLHRAVLQRLGGTARKQE